MQQSNESQTDVNTWIMIRVTNKIDLERKRKSSRITPEVLEVLLNELEQLRQEAGRWPLAQPSGP